MAQKDKKLPGADKPQRRLFKRKRAGVTLSRDQVREIKAGRKKLRKDMRAAGIRSKREFELTASSLGLYFDKGRLWAFLLWWRGKGLWALLGAAALLLLAAFAFSWLTQIQGHFTINMSRDMFREGFSLSETPGFENPVSNLFASPAVDVPCISIRQIPEDVDQIDGEHNADYFAYTFYTRNEGENSQDYTWQVRLNSESQALSTAAWIMVFEDSRMTFYASRGSDGQPEALPPLTDNDRGYTQIPTAKWLLMPDKQLQVVASRGDTTYYRTIPEPFQSDTVIASGMQKQVAPGKVHKYTVVIWLEGDDPDCTDALIGGHVGLEMNFQLVEDANAVRKKTHWWQIL